MAVVPDHRKYPDVGFPVWVEEAARAIRWVRDSIGKFGGDPRRIFVMGHSSGAHTATLLALDSHYLRNAGVPAAAVRGFISLAGPVATTWTDPDVQALMGPRELWPRTYPMDLVDGSAPPLLLLHGGRDRLVSPANSTRLAAHIRERGGCALRHSLPRASTTSASSSRWHSPATTLRRCWMMSWRSSAQPRAPAVRGVDGVAHARKPADDPTGLLCNLLCLN